jgi:hypothetical protein
MTIKTHDNGVRSFALSQDDAFISSMDITGTILIHSLKSEVTVLDGRAFTSNDLDYHASKIGSISVLRNLPEVGYKLSWFPHKDIYSVVVPAEKGATMIFSRKGGVSRSGDLDAGWKESALVGDDSDSAADMNLSVFSPNGRYLATANTNGTILLWAVDDVSSGVSELSSDMFNVVQRLECYDTLYDIAWGPRDGDNYLMVATATQWARFSDVVNTSSGACLPTGVVTKKAKTSTNEPSTNAVRTPSNSAAKTSVSPNLSRMVLASNEDPPARVAATSANGSGSIASPKASGDVGIAFAAGKGQDASKSTTSSAVKQGLQPPRRLQKKGAGGGESGSAAMEADHDDDDDDTLLERQDADPSWAAPATGTGTGTAAPTGTGVSASATATDSVEEIKRQMLNRTVRDDVAADDRYDDDGFIDDDLNQDGDFNAEDALAQALQLAAGGSSKGVAALLDAVAKAQGQDSQRMKLQAPIQLASTKLDEQKRRYMVWNNVGNIILRDEDASNRIEIRFSNTSGKNKGEVFTDNYDFFTAALSFEGALFATHPEEAPEKADKDPNYPEEDEDEDLDDKSKGSTIMYRAFSGQTQLEGANEVR